MARVLNFAHHHPNHSAQFLIHSSCTLCHSYLQFSPSTVSGHQSDIVSMPGTRSFQHFYKTAMGDANQENKRPRIGMDRSSDTPDDVSFPTNDSDDKSHHLALDRDHSPPSNLASRSHIDTAVCALADVLTLDVNSITSLVVKLNQLNTNIIA
jgi:hypothetical protein